MNAVAYCRYSSDNQREESIEAQARAIRDYCEKNSYTLINIYVDEARSATTDNRPQFLQMMKDAEKKQFEAVIVHKLDRFSRDRYDSAIYRKHLKKHRIKLISVLERLDDSPESIILESVLEGMAEFYSRNLAREVMKGMRENAYKCKHTGGKPPLGYDVTSDKTYVINQFEAGAIRLIFSLYADSNGYGEIIKQLNEAGYKTKAGRTFGTNSLSELLRNEKYIGNFIFNRMEQRADGKRNSHFRKKDEDIIRVDGGIPAIIDIETWKRVKSRVDNNKSKRGIISKVDYLLSGKIFCGK